MTEYAQVIDEQILEWREFGEGEIPAHKAVLWRPVEKVGSGTAKTVTIEPTRILITYSTPPPFLPEFVSPYQARVALLNAGLLDSVNAAVAAAPDSVKLAWEYATVVERNSPMIAALAGILGLTAEQVDQLFIAAGQVR